MGIVRSRSQFVQVARLGQPAAFENCDAIAKHFDIGKNVRTHEDGFAFVAQ
ncbi:hypothetical protein D3C83_260060 [compost metagenome]